MDKKPFKPTTKPGKGGNNRNFKNVGFVVLIVLFVLIIFAAYGQHGGLKTIPFSQAVHDANSQKYSKISVNGSELDITPKGQNAATLKTYDDPNASLKQQGFDLSKSNIQFKPGSGTGTTILTLALEYILPVVIIGALFFFMLRSAQGQGNQAMSFGKSKARLYGNEKD
ncbi:MAG: ATP-dependent zinc metalloprotease FtsH, partial [Candidatus Saccharimonadales bacterium]